MYFIDHLLVFQGLFSQLLHEDFDLWFPIVFSTLALAFPAVLSSFMFQRIHDICRLPVSFFCRRSADHIPMPYNVALCRKTLYQLLLTLLMSPLPQKPSPDQVLLKTFSLGINDQDLEVSLSEIIMLLYSCQYQNFAQYMNCSR